MDRTYQELETEQEILRKNEYLEFSNAISDFLDKSRQEIEVEIESRFQSMLQNNFSRNYLYEEIVGRQLIIFGCGARGRNLLRLLYDREDKILCCTDNGGIR